MAQESAETLLESLESEIEDLEKFEINPNFLCPHYDNPNT